MDLAVISQVTYLALSSGITVWVSRTLARHGRLFLVDAFSGNEPLADAVNHLLVVGFYLINLGWIARNVRDGGTTFYGIGDAIHAVSVDIGGVLLILGFMHFMNLWIFSRIRRKALARMEPPPVLPNEFLPESARARMAR
jgi:hypothetical protein